MMKKRKKCRSKVYKKKHLGYNVQMTNKKPRLLIIGYARHGKDTVAEMLSDNFGYRYTTSSAICSEKVIFPILAPLYGYKTVNECFEDRVNHRGEWYDLITEYNDSDRCTLARDIYSVSDVYCGLRNIDEYNALRNNKTFDYSIWVDRSNHLPPEDLSSNTLWPSLADHTIDNNGTLPDLTAKVHTLITKLEFLYHGS